MIAILSANLKEFTEGGRPGRFEPGSYAYDIEGAGEHPNLGILSHEERDRLKVYGIKELPDYDSSKEHITGLTPRLNTDGTLAVEKFNIILDRIIEPIPVGEMIKQEISRLKTELNDLADEKRQAGIEFEGSVVQTRDQDIGNLMGAFNMASEGVWEAPNDVFRMRNNTLARLTPAQAKEMAVKVSKHRSNCMVTKSGHEKSIGAIVRAKSDNLRQLQAYDITTGWPPVADEEQ